MPAETQVGHRDDDAKNERDCATAGDEWEGDVEAIAQSMEAVAERVRALGGTCVMCFSVFDPLSGETDVRISYTGNYHTKLGLIEDVRRALLAGSGQFSRDQ